MARASWLVNWLLDYRLYLFHDIVSTTLTFFIWNRMVDFTSSTLTFMLSLCVSRVGNLPALLRPGPNSLGICLIKLSEARKASYFLAAEEGGKVQMKLDLTRIESKHAQTSDILVSESLSLSNSQTAIWPPKIQDMDTSLNWAANSLLILQKL